MKKEYLKSTFRLFGKHIIRLLSITAIFIVSIGLMDGLGVVKYNVKGFVNDTYTINNVYDLKVMGTPKEINKVYDLIKDKKEEYYIKDLEFSFTKDIDDGEYAKRVSYIDFSTYKTNKLTLLEGRLPKSTDQSREEGSDYEAAVIEPTTEIKKHNIGDKIKVPFLSTTEITCTITGVVREPSILGKSKEPSTILVDEKDKTKGTKHLNDAYFINTSGISQFLPTSLNIAFVDDARQTFNCLSQEYLTGVNALKEIISKQADVPMVQILTLEQCFSYKSLISYSNKVGVIAVIFIVFFSLITLLVVFSTMSRLFDEDRGSMAVLKTLGYSNFDISMRYVLFMLIAGLAGTFLALLPAMLVNNMIINGFMMQYKILNLGSNVFGPVFFVTGGSVLFLSIILTLITSLKSASLKPVELLTPKAPKVGKKIFLERIKKIWNKLSFKYKSTCRNVFLFKGRFFMTFFSIIASTAIIFASLGLFDNSFKMTLPGIESLRVISIVLLIFSAALCALVVYNITNINISERTREIATLMVLGYREKEITGYIYREIYIMAVISSLVGLPAGIGFTAFVFKYMELGPMGGSIGNIGWYSYILTPILTCLFAFLATLLLKRRILKTDMNESLKTLE